MKETCGRRRNRHVQQRRGRTRVQSQPHDRRAGRSFQFSTDQHKPGRRVERNAHSTTATSAGIFPVNKIANLPDRSSTALR